MTTRMEDANEYEILSLMTADTKKFIVEIGQALSQPQQEALERLQLRDWIRLIDVSPVANIPGRMFRVFRVMPVAVEWYTTRTIELTAERQKNRDKTS